jgi:ATP-dependent Zn protease
MVTKFVFSNQVGLVYYGGEIGEEASSETRAANIDLEVKRMTDAVYARAKQDLLKIKHSKEHHLLAETLLEYEALADGCGSEGVDQMRRQARVTCY